MPTKERQGCGYHLERIASIFRSAPRDGEYMSQDEALAEEAHHHALDQNPVDMDAYVRDVLDYLEENDPNPPTMS